MLDPVPKIIAIQNMGFSQQEKAYQTPRSMGMLQKWL